MTRDKESTKQRLIDAVGTILSAHGFQGIGINAIAKEAGVDKVLIYRYFGNLDGLLEAFARQKDYFSNLSQTPGARGRISTVADAAETAKQIFLGQLRQIRSSPELQEVLLWELNQKNAVTDEIAAVREAQGTAVLETMRTVVGRQDTDLAAVANLLVGGIYYLVLRSRTVDIFNGIEFNREEGWQRIENAICKIIDTFMV